MDGARVRRRMCTNRQTHARAHVRICFVTSTLNVSIKPKSAAASVFALTYRRLCDVSLQASAQASVEAQAQAPGGK